MAPSYPSFVTRKQAPFDYSNVTSFTIKSIDTITFSKKGLYFIQIDPKSKDGFSINRFHEDFPKLTKPEHLVETLRYITKNEEYKHITSSNEKKLEIDKFWLKRTGNTDRARVLIKEYYTRVWNANIHFTSYKEGWKTDRGMVYVIYGEPDIIYKDAHTENWIYEESISEPLLSFSFFRANIPVTKNHFDMLRDIKYENSWHIAIHKWRHGRINELRKKQKRRQDKILPSPR